MPAISRTRRSDLRHLLGRFRRGQQNGAHHGRVVVLALLRGVVRHEKQPRRKRPPEGSGHVAQQPRGRRKIHVIDVKSNLPHVQIHIEGGFHSELAAELCVCALRVPAIVEISMTVLIFQPRLRSEFHLSRLSRLLARFDRGQLRQSLAHHRVRRVDEARAQQFLARGVQPAGNRVALRGVHFGLHQTALGNFAVNGILAVVRRPVGGIDVGGVGRVPVQLTLGAGSLLVGGFGLLGIGLDGLRLGRLRRSLRACSWREKSEDHQRYENDSRPGVGCARDTGAARRMSSSRHGL